MKSPMFILLSLPLFFTSCEKNADFATVATPSSVGMDQNLVVHEPPLTLDYCINLSTSHTLKGFGTFEIYRQSRENVAESNLQAGMFKIEASGKGTSEELGNSHAQMSLKFNSRTNRLSGIIVTTFDNGEILEQHIDSDALVLFEHRSMIIKANVHVGVLRKPMENLNLVRGEIVLGMPIHPEGYFEANLYTNGMYCTNLQ